MLEASITTGKTYEYHPSIVLNPTLHRQVTDEILASYEKWQQPIAHREVRR